LTEQDFPDGGVITTTYSDSGPTPEVVTNKKIDSSHALVVTVAADGMGHPIQYQLNSDPAGVDYTDAIYDGLGHVISASNPHRSTSAATDGITQNEYDVLGRVIQVTKEDGSVSSVSYVANCSIAMDEAGKRRRSCRDSLGRSTEVDEPTPGVSESVQATNASATVTLSGSLESRPSSNPATGTIAISGTDSIVPGTSTYDFGTVTVTIGNASVSTSYGNSGSSPSVASDVASALCAQITNASSTNTQVSCSTSGGAINLIAQAPGTAGNGIALGVSARTQMPQSNQSAFASSSTSGSLSGGGTPMYDSGSSSVVISGRGYSVNWSGPATTATGIASSLALAINNDPDGYATASASSNTISITAKVVGLSGNGISLACSSGYDTKDFSSPSFSMACPSGLSGGQEAGSLSVPMVSLYNYDALGNLLQIAQKGGTTDQTQWRMRTFSYDSLSRLLTTNNPESGTISYSYDANGNILQKTSPAPNQTGSATQTISYCYDSLNRVTGKAYTAQSCPLSSPVVTYTYDAGTNGIGHLTSLNDQAGSGSYSYEAMGRISGEQRTIAGISKRMSYLYNLDGSIQKLTYPSGAVINYAPDSAGRMLSAIDSGNNINYITGATYEPDSALTGFISGASSSFAGITNSFSFNNRLQPVNMVALAPATTGTSATASATVSGTLASAGYDLASGTSSLSPNRGSNPGQAVYLDSNQHLIAAALTASGASTWLDLTTLSGCCPAAANSALITNVNSGGMVYQAADQHIHQIWWWSTNSRWVNNDMTAASGAMVAAKSGTPLAAWSGSQGIHEVYIGTDNQIYDLYYNGATNSNSTLNLTTLSGGAAAVGNSSLTTNATNGGAAIYQAADGHIHQIWWWAANSRWVNNDMTAASGATVAARSGTPLAAWSDSQGIHEVYIGTDNHIYDLYYNGSTNSNSTLDLTSLAGGPGAAGNSALTSNTSGGGIVYQSPDGHIHQIWWWAANSRWVDNDMTAAGAATVAARPATPLAAITDSQGIHEVYLGQDNHAYDLYYNGATNSNSTRDMTANLGLDSGTVSLSIGSSFTATACFGSSTNSACTGQTANNTSSQVASALVQSLNASNSPVTATASGATINMTWKTAGAVTTPVSALSTTHDNPSLFPNPSFTSPATSFGGDGPIAVFSIAYDFHAGNGDNGNVFGIANNRDSTRNQTFTYDALNRLTSAQNAGTDCTKKTANNLTAYWGNSYGYDAWSNLLQKTVTKCGAENLSVIAGANNQIHTGNPPAQNQACATSPDYLYDAAGNMTCNLSGSLTPQSYTYDAENRISGAGGFTYTYDAGGDRVEKSNGSTGTIYWSMLPGIVAESDLSGALKSEYVFFDGERVARRDFPGNNVFYYFSDHLKSTSVITDSIGNIKVDEDFYPWGGELPFVNNDANHYKFTGKERDPETGLDYFGARYYGNSLGRWMSPDWAGSPEPVPFAHLGDPQSLNLYAYVRDLPSTATDPDGHFIRVNPPPKPAPAPTGPTWYGDFWQRLRNGWNYGGCGWTMMHCRTNREQEPVLRLEWLENITYLVKHGLDGTKLLTLDSKTVEELVKAVDRGDESVKISNITYILKAVAQAAVVFPDAKAIANGHAWQKHQGEFPGMSQNDFEQKISQTVQDAKGADVRKLSNGRTAYWNDKEGIVVIHDPSSVDRGTAFRPTAGRTYFDNLN